MSLVVPAFNEEERLELMLTEAVGYLQQEYGDAVPKPQANGNRAKRKDAKQELSNGHIPISLQLRGWEVLVVSDGSTDKTIEMALRFAKKCGKDAAAIRVIHLHENRGKGGAVTHGMRHVRGQYAVFADADGASKFEDLGKLVKASREMEDQDGRGVAVGSRAHLVGSEAVVKVIMLSLVHVAWSNSQAYTLIHTALIPPQPPHALLSSPTPLAYTSGYSRHTRYPMRLQTLLEASATLHNTLHALGRLDIRRRDAHACRIGWYTCGRSTHRMARSQGE